MVTKKELQCAEEERTLRAKEKLSAKGWLLLIAGILASGVLRAVSVYSFIVPNAFAPGGVTGIASMLEYKLHVNAGYFLFGINVPLLVIAFIFIGKRFGLVTGIAIVLSSALMVLFEKLRFPVFSTAETGADQVLAAVAGGILGGVGVAIMLKVGGSTGGTDIVAVLIQKRNSATNVAWFIFLLDSIVVLFSAVVYPDPLVPILLSFVEMFVSSKVNETISQGFKSAIKFEIITEAENAKPLADEIMDEIQRGVTAVSAKGMYTGAERVMLVCILRKREMTRFREILKKYPDTFAYVSGASEVVGKGFKS